MSVISFISSSFFLKNWFKFFTFENVKKPCSRDTFGRIVHNKFRKNITVFFDYFSWNIILLNGLTCKEIFQLTFFNRWKIKIPLIIFLYFYYAWMILKFFDNISNWFATYRLLRLKFTIHTEIFHKSLKIWLKCFSNFSVCNFQSMKSPVERNSLLSKFFCYIT